MPVKKGDLILAIDENRELEVEGLWGGTSKIIDFSAKYLESNLVDKHGNRVNGNRGFSFEDEGVKWIKK